jgi:hypothetical protein
MVLAEKQTPNHVLHLLLALVTVGFWIPVWVIAQIMSELRAYQCPHCGAKTRHKAPRGWKPTQRSLVD